MDWKQIDGYDNYYVSINGEVRNDTTGLILKQLKEKNGYYRVCLYKNGKKKNHYVHRLFAFAFIPLEPGKDFIDHEDGERTNNSVTNLRWANKKENAQNRTLTKLNTSGFKGVSFYKRTQKWNAQIMVDGKHINLGYFEKIEEAVAARAAKANEEFGEFTNVCERN
jgi:hypothetical protein